MGTFLRALLSISTILLALVGRAAEVAPQLDEDRNADSIVQAALRAEVDGDAGLRNALLEDAVRQDPVHRAARWHSGHVQIGDQWMSVDQVEHQASKAGVVSTYRNLRDQHSGTLVGELSLARWCRKNGLEDREKLHWENSLRFDPRNKEARRRLGVRAFRGRLLTAEQIEQWKEGLRAYQRAKDTWNPRLSRWRRVIENSQAPELTDAWSQLTQLEDPDAVPSLEKMIQDSELPLQLKIVSVLGNIEGQIAIDALVRLSVGSRSPEIRQATATTLADRSMFAFVPYLLSRLENPVEFQYSMNTLGSAVVSEVRYSQENAGAVVKVLQSVRGQVPNLRDPDSKYANRYVRDSIFEPFVHASVMHQKLLAQQASRQYKKVLDSYQAVQARNAQIHASNQRIFAALYTSTGQRLDPSPQYWWDWWKDYNELDDSEEKREIRFYNTHYYQVPNYLRTLSCFLAGTPVWTETGPVAIENVGRGDRVLSQDSHSGELGYQIVVDTTVRPPSETLRIVVEGQPIMATLGHPLWVVGSGWKMAKELNVGDQLHTVEGGVTIDAIDPGPIAEAYNLVVAETNTYFIGPQRVLAHDNAPRLTIDHALPGWVASVR